jgi:hypothetical protein
VVAGLFLHCFYARLPISLFIPEFKARRLLGFLLARGW